MAFLAPSVQRKIMYLIPAPVFEMLCRTRPKLSITLLCHLLNEKNPIVEERFLSPRLLAPVPVAKKISQLSVLSILNLLRQDESLWKLYIATPDGGKIIQLKSLPYILLELMFDLGGREGREKVKELLIKCRTTIGGTKQAEMLRNFKTDTVLDLFELLPEAELGMILKSSLRVPDDVNMMAFWLNQWDLRMHKAKDTLKSVYWLGKLPGDRAFLIEKAMKELEFRRPPFLEEETKI